MKPTLGYGVHAKYPHLVTVRGPGTSSNLFGGGGLADGFYLRCDCARPSCVTLKTPEGRRLTRLILNELRFRGVVP